MPSFFSLIFKGILLIQILVSVKSQTAGLLFLVIGVKCTGLIMYLKCEQIVIYRHFDLFNLYLSLTRSDLIHNVLFLRN